mgnify:CR=1 FL=1
MRRRSRTNSSLKSSPGSVMGGVAKSGNVYTLSGIERVASIITRRTQSQVLSELLNDLERQTKIVEYKYLEVCDTLVTAMEALVKHYASTLGTDTIEEESTRETL